MLLQCDIKFTASILLPYGVSAGDEFLPISTFISSAITFTCPFFGRNENSLHVSRCNAVLFLVTTIIRFAVGQCPRNFILQNSSVLFGCSAIPPARDNQFCVDISILESICIL